MTCGINYPLRTSQILGSTECISEKKKDGKKEKKETGHIYLSFFSSPEPKAHLVSLQDR